MNDIKSKVQSIDPNVEPRDIKTIAEKTGNIYLVLDIITKRAKNLSQELKQELHGKLEEFAIKSETLEEIHENKEQIEISKFYEKLPNPTIIAYNEFMNDELEWRKRDVE